MQKYNKHVLEEPVASTVISHRFSHVVWGAVFAGVVVVIAAQLALSLLGSSIGLSAVNVTEGNNLKTLGVSAIVWWVISGCASFYLGGLVSGRMAGIPRRLDGMLHGLLSLGVTTIITFFVLTTSLGAVIAGGFGLLNAGAKAMAGAAPQVVDAAKSVMPQEALNTMDEARNDLRQVLSQIQDSARREELRALVTGLMTTNDPQVQQQNMVTILTQHANMSEADARQTVDRWTQSAQTMKQNVQQAAQQAEVTAEDASKAAGKMAFASFVMLALGAIAAGLGGARGAPHWSDQEIA